MNSSKSSIGVFAVLLAGVLMLSTSGIFAALAVDAAPVIIAFYRLFFAVCVLLPFVLFHAPSRRELQSVRGRQLWASLAAGVFLGAHYVMWFQSIRFTTVSNATTVGALQPIFSMIWGALFLNERLSRRSALGAAIAIGGAMIIGWGDFHVSGTALWGDALALISGAVISLYYLFGQIARREMSTLPYSVLSYGSSVVFLALYALLTGESFFGYAASTWHCFLGLALVSTIGGQMVFNLLLRRVTATTVTMSILGEPIGTCILAMIFLGEKITSQLAVGMAVILLGLGLFFGGAEKQG